MIIPSVIRDIALAAAKDEYKTARRLGGTAEEATVAGCKVMLEIRQIATGSKVEAFVADALAGISTNG